MSSLVTRTSFDSLAGRFLRHIRRRHNGQCVNILTYHCISPVEHFWTAGTTLRHDPAEFEHHMDFVAEHYHPMRLSEFVQRVTDGQTPQRAVIITIDDGTADSLHFAAPILYRRRIPATIFPVTSVIGNKDMIWTHKLAWLEANGHEPDVVSAMQSAGFPARAEHESVSDYVRRTFRVDTPETLEAVLQKCGISATELAAKYHPYIEPDEMRDVDVDFIEFGNHTHTHPVLSALTEDQQRTEIIKARDILTEITGSPPIAFAYPFGLARHYDATSRRVAEETGHRAIVDMRRRINHSRTPSLDLSRKPAPVGSQTDFEMVLEDWPINAGMNL